ncbi:MAG: PPOX class F420-dependent oxidoreductase [Anaerolineae bacterium]|nr:PPOX class F420-dependent oxidoreductase [Anaerolineae bacterium]
MTPEEYRAFMMNTPRTGKLATVRADGRPHIAPIWFTMDGDDLIFSTWHESVKAANLLHDNRASLCVDDEKPPFAYAIVEGTVEIQTAPDPQEMLRWSTELAGRYMGKDQAEAYGKRNAHEGEYLLRLKPSKVIARTGIAD